MANTYYKIIFVGEPNLKDDESSEVIVQAKNFLEACDKARRLSDLVPGCTIYAISLVVD